MNKNIVFDITNGVFKFINEFFDRFGKAIENNLDMEVF